MDVSAIGGKEKKGMPKMGDCRKHAPVATTRDKRIVTRWPRTTEKKWCGDFEPSHGMENDEKERCGVCSYWKELEPLIHKKNRQK